MSYQPSPPQHIIPHIPPSPFPFNQFHMISDYFSATHHPNPIRSHHPAQTHQPFTIPEHFYRHTPHQIQLLMHGRSEWPNLKDLRIMLKQYLKYRKPHSEELRNAKKIMENYMSQEEYFRVMEEENRELRRKNIMYRKYTGGQDARSVERMLRGCSLKRMGSLKRKTSCSEEEINESVCKGIQGNSSKFVENMKKVGRKIQRKYFRQ